MKNIVKTFAVACAVAAAASCSPYVDYQTAPFVTFTQGTAVTVDENAGVVKLPIATFNTDETISVGLSLSGDAVEGVDYEILSGSVLTVAPGEETVLEVKIIEHPDEFKGNLVLNVALTPSGSGVEPGGAAVCTIKINELDVNYNWEWLAGTWKAQDWTSAGAPDDNPYEVQIVQTGDNTGKLKNLWGCPESALEFTVDFEAKTLEIKYGFAMNHSSYGPFNFYGYDPDGNALTSRIYGVLSAAGIELAPWYCYQNGLGGWGPYTSSFTR